MLLCRAMTSVEKRPVLASAQSPALKRWRTRLLSALTVFLAHLAFSHSLGNGQHARLLRLAAFPLFIASRWSTTLTRFVRWRGGWPAAIVESALVGVALAAIIELLLSLTRRSR